MIYLASPFSHPDKRVEFERYEAVLRVTQRLFEEGKVVFASIVYGYHLQNDKLSGAHETWLELDQTMIRTSTEVWVLCLPGWQESRGVTAEITFAMLHDIPVSYFYG